MSSSRQPEEPAPPRPANAKPGAKQATTLRLLDELAGMEGAVRVYRGEGGFLLLHLLAAEPQADPAPGGKKEACKSDGSAGRAAKDRSIKPTRTERAGPDDDFVMRLYLRDAAAEPVLSDDEEFELSWRARLGDTAAREQLVRGSLRLVVHIAFDYRGFGLPLADLVNEGNLGLLRAAELFDPLHGQRFGAYAALWIRQRMRRALSYQAWPVRLPAALAWQHNRLRDAEQRLRHDSAAVPDDRAVAEASGLSPGTVRRLRAAPVQCFVSLDDSPAPEDAAPLGDTLADETAPAPDAECSRRSDDAFVQQLLATLTPHEQRVLRLRFGLDDDCPRTLEEVGQVLGRVRQGIQKIEAAALAKLRHRARRMELGATLAA